MKALEAPRLVSLLRALVVPKRRVGTLLACGVAALCFAGKGSVKTVPTSPTQTVEPAPFPMYRPWHPAPPPLEHGDWIRVQAPKSCAWNFLPAQFLEVYRMASPFDGWLPLFMYAMKRSPGYSPSDCMSLGMEERCVSVERLAERLKQRSGVIYDIDGLASDCLEEYGLQPCYFDNALSCLTIFTYEPWPPVAQRKPLLDPRPIRYLDSSYDAEGRVVEIRWYLHSRDFKSYHMTLASRTVICYGSTGKIRSIYQLMPERCDYGLVPAGGMGLYGFYYQITYDPEDRPKEIIAWHDESSGYSPDTGETRLERQYPDKVTFEYEKGVITVRYYSFREEKNEFLP